MTDLKKFFRRARRTAVPLVAIQTPDVQASMRMLHRAAMDIEEVEPPAIQWDCVYGLRSRNTPGNDLLATAAAAAGGGASPAGMQTRTKQLLGCCMLLLDLLQRGEGDRVLVFLMNPHPHFRDPAAVQALALLRNAATRKGMTITMLIPDGVKMPRELALDVAGAVESVPDDEHLGVIVDRICGQARADNGEPLPPPSPEDRKRAVGALRGLPAFAAEQALALALAFTPRGLDVREVLERKIAALEAIDGMEIWTGGERFDDLAGVDQLADFARALVPGVELVVLIDEIEKQISTSRDDSGAGRAQLGQMLTFMEDRGVDGLMLVGCAGNGKSHLAKAMANEAQTLCVAVNWGQAKNKYVGETEANTARILRTIDGLAPRGGVLFVATSNDVTNLPPELLSRFTLGTFMLDLPDAKALRQIHRKRATQFGLKPSTNISDAGYSGRDVRNLYRLAARLGRTAKQVENLVVPLSRSNPEAIETLRAQAHGRWLSASRPGVYRNPSGQTAVLGVVVQDEARAVRTGDKSQMN